MTVSHKISPLLSKRLDATRAVAAGMVVICHFRGHYFLPYAELDSSSRNIINFLLFSITRLGRESVIVFFVLSGYLVGGNALSHAFLNRFRISDYLVKRFTRMWIVLIPALLLGFLCDTLSIHLKSTLVIDDFYNLKTVVGNVFFLQGIKVPVFGSNAPLWSLAYEFWYYIIWGIGYIAATKFVKNSIVSKFIFILLLIGVYFLMPDVILLFPIWMLGVLARITPVYQIVYKKVYLVLSVIFMGAAIFYSMQHPGYMADYFVGLSSYLIILRWQAIGAQIAVHEPARTIHPNNFQHKLAQFSFSLYAVHFFLMMLCIGILNSYFGFEIRLRHANFQNWMIYCGSIIITYFIAFGFYTLTEKHTDTLRKKIISILNERLNNNAI